MPDKPLSEAQLAANRANSRKSSGPRTPEGLARSSQNSFKHGLFSRNVFIPVGQEDFYDQFVAGIVGSLHPGSPLELQVCHDVANAHWRLSHLTSVEAVMFTLPPEAPAAPRSSSRPAPYDPYAHLPFDSSGHIPIDPDTIAVPSSEPPVPRAPEYLRDAARVFLHRSQSFSNLTLYEQRLHRGIKASMEELRRLQAEREARVQRDMPRAIEHYKEQLMHKLTFDPAADGFVFSLKEIDTAYYHDYRAKQVDEAAKCKFKLSEYEKLHPKKAA